jgi:hypothetical protein
VHVVRCYRILILFSITAFANMIPFELIEFNGIMSVAVEPGRAWPILGWSRSSAC